MVDFSTVKRGNDRLGRLFGKEGCLGWAAMIRFSLFLAGCLTLPSFAEKIHSIWPGKAPGELTENPGTALPANPRDPSITRVEKVTKPTLTAYPAPSDKATGAAVVVLPGGGFGYVVPDLEGSEATKFLHEIGVSVFVLNYRTKTEATKNEPWKRPLQDSQRAVRYVRANAGKWGVDKGKVGILAFSAGGQVGAIHLGAPDSEWKTTDKVDQESSQLDFAMLIYPWKVLDGKTGKLMEPIKLGKEAPPTFIVHTSDDASTSLGAVEIYAQLKKSGVSSELHVYQNGGHGYGVREKKGSAIGKWSAAAADWLVLRGIGKKGS